jgi:hypothetical protein
MDVQVTVDIAAPSADPPPDERASGRAPRLGDGADYASFEVRACRKREVAAHRRPMGRAQRPGVGAASLA